MHGRASLLSKVVVVAIGLGLLSGCEPPRIKSFESTQAATNTNPPRDFTKAPLDPYSYGGIAMATGGRDPKTSYGAMAPGDSEGATQIYRKLTPEEEQTRAKEDNSKIYLVPDPRREDLTAQYLGSRYIDNNGGKITDKPGILNANPPRAGLQPVSPK